MTHHYNQAKILYAGDSALTVEFANVIAPDVNDKVRQLYALIKSAELNYIRSLIPTYRSLTVIYDPVLIDDDKIKVQLRQILTHIKDHAPMPNRKIELPVCYDASLSPDLSDVAAHHQLNEQDIIFRHSAPNYLVYMLGFTPGFPYLGGMDTSIATPRKQSPRLNIKEGAVGIADKQTGVYSVDSPGGWQIIGKTPLKLFDKNRSKPFLLAPGDILKFKPISLDEFNAYNVVPAQNQSTNWTDKKDKGAFVISPGMLTTVQDSGRYGYEAYGVTHSGVMDHFAYRVANMLVDNPQNTAVLEITLLGPNIRFNTPCQIAITGADMTPRLNGNLVNLWQSYNVTSGATLSFGGVVKGARAYLAVHGGIDASTDMNSQSTDIKAGLGGLNGSPLKKGDILPLKETSHPLKTRKLKAALIPIYHHHHQIRVILGPQDDYFSNDSIKRFFNENYTIDQNSNRMGYRLNGVAIMPKTSCDIISDAVVFGSIQITNSGQPVIMMADHQTTGGYAKIATVISADLPKLAQAKPGDSVKFEPISIEKAQQLLKESAEQLTQIKRDIMLNERDIKQFNVTVNNAVYNVEIEEI